MDRCVCPHESKTKLLEKKDAIDSVMRLNLDSGLSGAVQDAQLLFEVGYQVANGDKFPEWKPSVEFNRVKGSASRGQEIK
jgi:hypothetical protein